MKIKLSSAFLVAQLALYFSNAAQAQFSSILEFAGQAGPNKGSHPWAELASDGAGHLWGTTSDGGANNFGTIFKIDTATGGFASVLDFTGISGPNKGSDVYGGMVSDGAGNFWGTTASGGASGEGTIFKLDAGTGVLTTVVEFTGVSGARRGSGPSGALVSDGTGNFWGTTAAGGSARHGTIFKVNAATGTLTTVAEFNGIAGTNKGGNPRCALVSDGAGSFWGTTASGGVENYGTVFKVNASTGALTTLIEFHGDSAPEGVYPFGSLANDGLGNFWGMTDGGGAYNLGTVFKINAAIGVLTTVVEFTGNGRFNKGSGPNGGLASDGAGKLWGTTSSGGSQDSGTIFKLNLGSEALSTVLEFTGTVGANRGQVPFSTLTRDGAGNFWGTTVRGGPQGYGTVFKIAISGHQAVAMENDSAVGTSGATFKSFGLPAINENGHVAFQAKISGAGTHAANNSGIWADDSLGVRQLVVRTGDDAGVGGAVFATVRDPIYNNNDEVAFIGTLMKGTGTTTAQNDTGVWSTAGGTLHLVAREGSQAPGYPEGVTFLSFGEIVMPDQNGVVMLAKVTGSGVAGANNLGIWGEDAAGNLQLLLQKGVPHPVTGQVITALSFLPVGRGVAGQTRGFISSSGNLLYRASFANRSSGIFKLFSP